MVEIIRARKGNIVLVGIGIEPEEPFVLVNGTQQLTARAKPRSANKGAITWSGGSSSTITVDANGLITGKKAESRVAITAISDAGFSTWVYARCGYDVTDLAFAADTLTIEGIQGVLFSLTPTPSNATEISYTTESDDASIADYYISSTANQRRMWGYNVGTTIVRAVGRSGNAERECVVTVTPVEIEALEFREGYTETVTEQGDSIPPIVRQVSMLVGQRASISVYFVPFNTTERLISASFDAENIASIDMTKTLAIDRTHGTFRHEYEQLYGLNKGVTNLTFTPLHGESATVEVNVFNVGEISGSGRFTSLGSGEGMFSFTISSNVVGFLYGVRFVPDNNGATNNWTYYSTNPYTIRCVRQDGSKNGYPSGHLSIYLEDGTEVKLTNTVSGTI